MTVLAEGRVETPDAQRYLEGLCRQLGARAETNVRVKRDGSAAAIDLGWARYDITAAPAALAVRIEAADDEAFRQAGELLRRHLEAHVGEEPISLSWDRQDAPIAGTDADRRDAMRGFHARMRRSRQP